MSRFWDVPGSFATALPLTSQYGPLFCCMFGHALNDAGQATGWAYNPISPYIATTAANTAILGIARVGKAINETGQIAGTGYNGNGAFMGDAMGLTALPQKASWDGMQVFSLSETGVVTGAGLSYTTFHYELFTATTSGILSSQLLDPASLGWQGLTPQAANKSARTAGVGVTGAGNWVAWVLSVGGALQTIPATGTWSYMNVLDINEHGTLVGEGVRNGAYVPWLYSPTAGFIELGGFSIAVTNIWALNDREDILASAGGSIVMLRSDGMTASPSGVPEPGTLLLMGAGLGGLPTRRRYCTKP
jgi:hypothetical protein